MKSCYYNNDYLYLHYLDNCSLDAQETVLFLHGFTGSSQDFLSIPKCFTTSYRCLVPDLPGHGITKTLDASYFTAERQVALLEHWLNSLGQSKFHLLGYSMGGRLALQFAVKNSHQLHSLTLISTTAGISEEAARQARVNADRQLAQRILHLASIEFLNIWLSQPLFQGIVEKGQDFVAKEGLRRLPLQPLGLTYSLEHFGSGVMPSVWHQLANIQVPTLVLAGEKDAKYLALGTKLTALIAKATLKVLPSSHAPLVECPEILWQSVQEFLSSL